MKHSDYSKKILFAVFISLGLPILGSLVCVIWIPGWRWPAEHLHVMVETMGGCIALVLAGVLLSTRDELRHFEPVWVASGLASMGLLDIFHASVSPGLLFVWFHSTAQFFGGFFFVFVAFLGTMDSGFRTRYFLSAVIGFVLMFGGLSYIFPEKIPDMIIDGKFTILARILNIAGGTGFLIAALHFAFRYRESQNMGDYLFTIHAALFGMSGVLFELSVLWDAAWWWWHLLRLVAYVVGLSYAAKVFLSQGELLLASNIDLEKKTREQENALALLARASKTKSEFLAQMSHELRTPLNSIIGFSQVILNYNKVPIRKDIKENVSMIEASGQSLLALINQVLNLSKIEAGEIEVTQESVDLQELVFEVVNAKRSCARENNISIVNEINEETDCCVLADRRCLKQVLTKLVSNAIVYNKTDGNVTISCEKKDRGKVAITITDTGIGIAEGDLSRIYDPFERLSSENIGVSGAGVGLTIAKKLVELMKGQIEVRSEVGKGTTFTLYFPLPGSSELREDLLANAGLQV